MGFGNAAAFRVAPEQHATLQDVIAVLELRIGVESEAAALAAQRRTKDNLRQMRDALAAFGAAVEGGRDAVGADFQFHLEVARAAQNRHFSELLASLGSMIIPRARLDAGGAIDEQRRGYLRLVNVEHQSILDAIAAATPTPRARRCACTWSTAANGAAAAARRRGRCRRPRSQLYDVRQQEITIGDKMKPSVLLPLLIAACAAWPAAAYPQTPAQNFPARTVTLVVPFPPGGGTDTARASSRSAWARNGARRWWWKTRAARPA